MKTPHATDVYRSLFQNAADCIFCIDAESGVILGANKSAETLTGYPKRDLLKMKISSIHPPDHLDSIRRKLNNSVPASVFEGTEILRRDGSSVPVEISATSLISAGKKTILEICRDVSRRQSMEKLVRQLASVMDTMRPCVILTDLSHRITYANPSAFKILGYREEELLGKPAYEIFEKIPGNPNDLAGTIRQEAKNGYWEGEVYNKHKSGKVIPTHLRMCLVRDEKNEVIGFAGISEDITRRKKLEEELIQREKLSAIGKIVAGIAHEINNPLTAVLGYAELLTKAKCQPAEKEDIKRLYREAIRCQFLVKNLLAFARRSAPIKELVNINDVIRHSLGLRAQHFKSDNIKVATVLNPEMPLTLLDFNQINQVLNNIINNAHYALLQRSADRKLTIRSVASDEHVIVSIANNGPHIPHDALTKIFDPFFTTKEFGTGAGMGLSIALGIVKAHGGDIQVESREGGETVFNLIFRLVQREDEIAKPSPAGETTV